MKNQKIRHTDLTYLLEITKENTVLLIKMISTYLTETPNMIIALKQSFINKDWVALRAEAHKLIPTFRIVGMSEDFEKMTYKIKEYNGKVENYTEVEALVLELESNCKLAFKELNEEIKKIKT